jgi:CRP/FNR family transcriptional regulator
LRELCLPVGLSAEEVDNLSEVIYTRRKVAKGRALFRARDRFLALYAVRTGFFKTAFTEEHRREQVTGFHMPGELLGMEGIVGDSHACDAIALEDSEVCVIPYAQLERFIAHHPNLQRQLHRIMSREIVRDQGVMLLLGSMRAEERLAAFLLNLAQRFAARGFSPQEFNLRMTRNDIGSYLGLKLETVSRAFSRFHDDGLLAVQQRQIRILDPARLKQLVSGAAACQ